jgi:branched-chain amino acid transport system permease protein
MTTASADRWAGTSTSPQARAIRGSAVIVGCLGLVTLYGQLASSSAQFKIELLLINVVLAVGLQLFSGNSGILSFGHMTFVALGAYVAAILTLDPVLKTRLTGLPTAIRAAQLSSLEAAAIAVGVAGLIALVIGIPILRLAGPSAVIAIFALVLISNVVLTGWTGVTQGAGGLYALPTDTTLLGTFIVASLAVVVGRCFYASRAGLQLRCSREDPLAAASIGVRVHRLRLVAWTLSAMVSAAAGVLTALLITAISPSGFYLSATFPVVVMIVVGGIETVGGAVIGSVIVTVLGYALQPVENGGLSLGFVHIGRLTGLTQGAFCVMILLVMYFRPAGLLGPDELETWLARAARRIRSMLLRRRISSEADVAASASTPPAPPAPVADAAEHK